MTDKRSEAPEQHWHTNLAAAQNLERLFEGTYERWEICGTVRRCKPGFHVEHVVIPIMDGERNLVWIRAAELAAAGRIAPWDYPVGQRWTAPEAAMIGLRHGEVGREHGGAGRRHELYLATQRTWGMRLAQFTGPHTFWLMLVCRLQYTGALKIHGRQVCWVNRAGGGVEMVPVDTSSEQAFFHLARTRWKEPRFRYEQPAENALRGMEGEFLPAGCVAYADPMRQPYLFDTSKPARRR